MELQEHTAALRSIARCFLSAPFRPSRPHSSIIGIPLLRSPEEAGPEKPSQPRNVTTACLTQSLGTGIPASFKELFDVNLSLFFNSNTKANYAQDSNRVIGVGKRCCWCCHRLADPLPPTQPASWDDWRCFSMGPTRWMSSIDSTKNSGTSNQSSPSTSFDGHVDNPYSKILIHTTE